MKRLLGRGTGISSWRPHNRHPAPHRWRDSSRLAAWLARTMGIGLTGSCGFLLTGTIYRRVSSVGAELSTAKLAEKHGIFSLKNPLS
jgi:hypothetical protein